ncbi:unnamed protein product [Dictyota dichotoma]
MCKKKKCKYIFKVIWGKQTIGIAVDKGLNNNRTSPITTFFFWPKENGWELLKNQLYTKPWISEEDRLEILNGYNKIITYWLEGVNKIDNITRLTKMGHDLKLNLNINCFNYDL